MKFKGDYFSLFVGKPHPLVPLRNYGEGSPDLSRQGEVRSLSGRLLNGLRVHTARHGQAVQPRQQVLHRHHGHLLASGSACAGDVR